MGTWVNMLIQVSVFPQPLSFSALFKSDVVVKLSIPSWYSKYFRCARANASIAAR